MKQTSKMLLGFLGGLVVCLPAPGADPAADSAAPADNPYQSIVERNVFHLNPPPPPPDPEANKPPPPKIFLTGITTLMGHQRALLKATPAAKPGEPAKEKSYLLTEGERQDELEVLAIDEKEGSVKLNYAGVQITVNFKDNAAASTAPATPGPVPGAPGQPPTEGKPGFRPPNLPPRPVRG